MIRDLVLKNRSHRRFHQEVAIELETLRELVDLARLSASARYGLATSKIGLVRLKGKGHRHTS